MRPALLVCMHCSSDLCGASVHDGLLTTLCCPPSGSRDRDGRLSFQDFMGLMESESVAVEATTPHKVHQVRCGRGPFRHPTGRTQLWGS